MFCLVLFVFNVVSCGDHSQPLPTTHRPPVIFIGLDGADWQYLDVAIANGIMPNLAALTHEGESGILKTIHPPLSPLVWSSMMTGATPIEHRILDFTRFNPRTGEREPITSSERKLPAIWNMLSLDTARPLTTAVFGLWATWPAEPVRGVLVSDRLFSFQYAGAAPPEGVVWPGSEEAWARGVLDSAVADTGFDALREYLPWLTRTDYDASAAAADPYANPVSALRRILIETTVYDRLASGWIERAVVRGDSSAHALPDLTILYLQGTDTIGHEFAPYRPPRQSRIPQEEFDRFVGVADLYFASIDRLLGRYRDLAQEYGAVLMLASDHGFQWNDGRPERFGRFAAATAGRWHRDDGMFLLRGPGITRPAPDATQPAGVATTRLNGSVLQVCPTLLALLGLPPDTRATGLGGSPLPGVAPFESPPVDYRAPFDSERAGIEAREATGNVTASDSRTGGMPSSATQGDRDDAVRKLESLGYVDANEPMARQASDGSTRTAGSYNNEGLILREAGDVHGARAAFEQAIAVDSKNASALWNLSDLLADDVARDPTSGAAAGIADRSDELLIRAVAAGLPDGGRRVVERAIRYREAESSARGGGGSTRAGVLLDRAIAASPGDPAILLYRGRCRIESGECREALTDFDRAARFEPANALVFSSRGLAKLCLGDIAGARLDFGHSLELDPDQPEIRKALAQ